MLRFFFILFFVLFATSSFSSSNEDFNSWLIKFKKDAIKKGISEKTVNSTLKNVKYLENVIKYDRKQPEFFEDTKTYIGKRATRSRVRKAKKIFKENESLFYEIEKKFNVEKEILLALWAIETNFGKHVGKMDILSCLATLSFDKRRSDFFTEQLLILLKLIDKKLIDPNTLYGSWAGAFGNFQFMPSTIKNYAIDYDKNKKIELKKSLKDSAASAANYINRIGWKYKTHCFKGVSIKHSIPKKYKNTSARNIKNHLTVKKWKKLKVLNPEDFKSNNNEKAALIIPDGNDDSPAYLVFSNYEKILKWNRSLRFALTVCTLAEMIKNEI